ncbi:MAG: TetR family transcriptional regulator [Streptosporangiales bacterium]
MSTERTGLRERKKRETRIALSWAAIRLSVEHGFDNVLVGDIAGEVGVSARTFNNYFASKGEAIAARHYERGRMIADALRDRPASEPLWEGLTSAALNDFGLGVEVDERRPPDEQWIAGLRLMISEPAVQGEFFKANAAVEEELAAAVAERTGLDVTRDLYPRLVAGAFGVAVRAAMSAAITTEPPARTITVLRDALRQFAAGLPTP